MWGWTAGKPDGDGGNARKPHVCGDGPPSGASSFRAIGKTPRMWGWTEYHEQLDETTIENPTYVGMDRLVKAPVLHKECKPHVCGDGPILDEQEVRLTQ